MSREAKEKRLIKAVTEATRAAWAIVREWEPPFEQMPEGLTEQEQVDLVIRAKSAECVTKVLGLAMSQPEFVKMPGFVFDEGILASAMHNSIKSIFDAYDMSVEAGAIPMDAANAVKGHFCFSVMHAMGVSPAPIDGAANE